MDYYIAPRFLDKLAVHITKNFLELPGVRVPLILGIHGRKGEGKTFQCELVFQRMGIEVVHMSAGELESPDAGDPSRLIRLRYREAAELIRVRGKMTVLMINDLDAGAGRFDQGTQYTVNTQLVNGTLMNIADNPTNVQLPGSYDEKPIHRVPILVTGNDFSTLYAPLIRDGRMEKFYWEPDRSDRVGIVGGIFQRDGLSRQDVETLVDRFPNQSIDFFSALRARLYDEQVRQFIHDIGFERVSLRVVNSDEAPPEFRLPDFSLQHLLEVGSLMVGEQERVRRMRLSREYNETSQQASASRSTSGNGGSKESTPLDSIHQEVEQHYFRPYQPDDSHAPSDSAQRQAGNGKPSKHLDADAVQAVKTLINQGNRVGLEYVDERRFRTNSWKSYKTVQGSVQEAIAALEACLAEHENDYVRVVGIEPDAKQRIVETIIQRPKARR